MKITNAKNLSTDQPIKMVVFGVSGIGKTSLAKTLDGRTLIISSESGLLSIAGHDIDIIDMSVDDNGVLLDSSARIKKLGEAYAELLKPEFRDQYQNVFIDSLSEIGQLVEEKSKKNNLNSENKYKIWSDIADDLEKIFRAFRDLPKLNVIFTALEDVVSDESGKQFVSVELPGKAARKALNPLLDEVLRLTADEAGGRILFCDGDSRVRAKDRSGKLNKIEPANLSHVFKKIRGTKEP